jgi:hypothetical protein
MIVKLALTEEKMGFALMAWLTFVGVATYILFSGLVEGMPALDIAIKRILS